MGELLVTFLICSHQAPASLDAALESIAAQERRGEAEVVVVNNGFASSRAEELLGRYSSIQLRMINEARPGLGFARRAGFKVAAGKFLVLLDDDNTIGAGFLPALLETIGGDEQLGAVIARIEAAWETPPAGWVVDVAMKCLSINTAGKYKPTYADQQYWAAGQVPMSIRPPGGGMIIRRDACLHYMESVVDEERIGLARKPTSLVGCEDEDIFRSVPHLKLAVRYDQRLLVRHHIPRSRTRLKYLLRLNLQMSYSYGMLYGYVKPEARFSYRMEAGRLLRNGGACLRDCAMMRMHVAQTVVELSREIGWTAGRWTFERKKKAA